MSAPPDFTALATRLADAAQAVVRARLERDTLARRQDPRRWRRAALLWPLFGKDR